MDALPDAPERRGSPQSQPPRTPALYIGSGSYEEFLDALLKHRETPPESQVVAFWWKALQLDYFSDTRRWSVVPQPYVDHGGRRDDLVVFSLSGALEPGQLVRKPIIFVECKSATPAPDSQTWAAGSQALHYAALLVHAYGLKGIYYALAQGRLVKFMKLENIRSQQIPSGKPDPYSALDIEADHVYIHDILANILAEPFLGH